MTRIEFSVDRPRPGAEVRSFARHLEVSGWAAASEAVSDVLVRIAGEDWHRATYCQPRPDVQAARPDLVHAGCSGFRVFVPWQRPPDRIDVRVVAGERGRAREATVQIASEIREIPLASLPQRGCPWCGADSARLQEAVEQPPFHLVGCPVCRFAMAEPLPAEEDLSSIYQIDYWENAPAPVEEGQDSPDVETICELFGRYGNGGRRVLEVGCGRGSLLSGLCKRGYSVRGQDLAENAAPWIEDKFGIPIHRGALTTHPEVELDFVVSRHVLEHSPTPRADLGWIRDRLAPGGIVVLLTPNWGSAAAALLGSSWEWFVPPIHLGYFSEDAFERCAAVAGLQLRFLATREGDAAPLGSTLAAFLDYEGRRLPSWRRDRCRSVLHHLEDGRDVGLMEVLGHGQELVVVLGEPSSS